MASEKDSPGGRARRARPVGGTDRSRSFVPGLVISVFAIAAVYLAVPEAQIAVESALMPARAGAKQACRDAARSGSPGFTRYLRHGRAHAVSKGFYVDDVVIGDTAGNAESELEVTCYVDDGGTVVASARRPWTRPPPEDPRDDTFPVPGKAH